MLTTFAFRFQRFVFSMAALLMAYFPDLTAEDVRQILLDSSRRYLDYTVPRPGDGQPVTFSALSVTGGVVNAAAAVEAAMRR